MMRRRSMVTATALALVALPILGFTHARPADDGSGDGGVVVAGRLVGGSLNSSSITVETASGRTVVVRLNASTRVSMEVQGTIASLAQAWTRHQVTVDVVEVPGSNPPIAQAVALKAHARESGDRQNGHDQGSSGSGEDFQLPGQDN